MSLRIPPLPSAWPFAPRQDSTVWLTLDGQDLDAAGAGWSLVLPEGLELPRPIEPLDKAFGRGGILRAGDAVIRPYRRGGWMRFLSQGAYASPRRFEREWEIHRALWTAGFPTVEPLGYGRRRSGLAWEGLLLTRLQPGVAWPGAWEEGRARLPELQQAIDALCVWGLWAPDLNATNVLVVADGIRLLDWDRAAFVPGAQLRPLYARRMARSLKKLDAPMDLREAFGVAR